MVLNPLVGNDRASSRGFGTDATPGALVDNDFHEELIAVQNGILTLRRRGLNGKRGEKIRFSQKFILDSL
jgi:hypothetical protein